MRTQEYVVGLMFDETGDRIVLIRKNRPKWQAGLLNGVGGHIGQETAKEAMVREFYEETGMQTSEEKWKPFALLKGPGFHVTCYVAVGDVDLATSPTDEQVIVMPADRLGSETVENLPWLVPLAWDHWNDGRPEFVTAKYPY